MALADVLGLPNTRGRLSLITAQSIDALGTGLFLPFAVVYFHAAKGMPLTTVGAVLSIAALLSLPAGPVVGTLIDRFGARRVVIASNLLRVLTFTGYVVAETPWQLVVLVAVTMWGESMFWPASGALVAQVADQGQRARWYAMERSLRNMGVGLGGLIGGLLVAAGGTTGYTAVVVLNAVTFLAAALLFASWSPGAAEVPATGTGRARPRGSYREVLTHRVFRSVLVTVCVFALFDLSLTVLLTAYVIEAQGLPAWQPGVLFAVNTVLVVLAQTVVSRRAERHHRPRVLQVAAAIWLLSFALFAVAPGGQSVLAFAVLVLAVVVFTVAELLQAPTSSALTVEIAAEHVRGRYLGLEELMWSVARVLAPAAFTWLLAAGPALPWLALSGGSVVAILVLQRLSRELPQHARREAADGRDRTDERDAIHA